MINNLDERSKTDFLVYANSVIKSRAIPSVEDNLKPIHRKILYTLYEDKVTPDKPTKKCATEAGRALAYSPHGDASVYGALVRLSQWWKIRYPLIEMQGNCGNILGDGPAASRYTECRLSPIGMLMLDELNQNCVDFKPNYDNTTTEPVTLPSKFPYLLCGNNSGIAVGMSSDLVSHNFNEVADAIKYYIVHKDCTIADLMQYIKGPDFPTGGQIMNGEDLLNIYTTGRGAVRVNAHYDVIKKGTKTILVFHDLPYGVDIDGGVKAPLKKLVIEDGYDVFEDIDVQKVGPHNFDISVTLGKTANVAECLNILFTKTRLSDTIKINQTLIVNGEPKVLSLKDLIAYWVDYRSNIIKRIAKNDYDKTNHKLTVTLGLQKCMSDIDKLINLIRNSDSRADAKVKIMKEFTLNDEQADAVLDMKLSRLSKLDLTELNDTEHDLEKTLARLKEIINNENKRYEQIIKDLEDIKKIIGDDSRITEITYHHPVEELDTPIVKKEYYVYKNKIVAAEDVVNGAENDLVSVVSSYSADDIIIYNKEELSRSAATKPIENRVGAFSGKKNKLVAVTKCGNIKVSLASDYRFNNAEKVMKLKDGDELVYVNFADDDDYLILWNGATLLKLAIKDLPIASKLTIGVKSGFSTVSSASVVKNNDLLFCMTSDNKGKFVSVKDFNEDSRGNKGQTLAENTIIVKHIDNGRENIFLIPKQGKPIILAKNKVSIKGRTAAGANISTRIINDII